MQLRMYSIHDSKGEVFTPPRLFHTHGEAERDFGQMAEDEKTYISKFPEDYDLFFVGSFDTTTGKLTALTTPEHIVKAINAKRKTGGLSAIN